jgi:hypothetical protein
VIGLLLAAAFVGQAQQASTPMNAKAVVLSAPTAVVELDLGKMKGDLQQLSWSPDGTQIYIQTAEADLRLGAKVRHYLVALDGKGPKSLDAQPPWAARYWMTKSSQTAPGIASMKIEIEQQTKTVSATARPGGGDMARGGGSSGNPESSMTGVTVNEALGAAQQSQGVRTVTLTLKGEVVGEFVNEAVNPGATFGWGPSGSGLLAYVNQGGRLALMDSEGRKQELSSSKAVTMPAFSEEGTRIAYLEKTGRKKATLRVVTVTVQ